jgi:hypothetical protein
LDFPGDSGVSYVELTHCRRENRTLRDWSSDHNTSSGGEGIGLAIKPGGKREGHHRGHLILMTLDVPH